jgi:hypothetical protein
MSPSAILLPVFVQVWMTFYLGFRLGFARRGAIQRGDMRLADMALGQKPWPDRIQKIGNAYENQFELPVAFYTLVAFAMITSKADFAFVVLAWVFVGSRIAHMVVHTTSNHVPTRFRLFLASGVILLVMWIMFALRILAGTA